MTKAINLGEALVQKYGMKGACQLMNRIIGNELIIRSNRGRKQIRREYPRSGIAVQSRHENHEFQTASAYLVQIGKAWFRVEHVSGPIYNQAKQDSENMLKWNSYGDSDHFNIEPCKSPAQWLPDIVSQFVDRHVATGCLEAEFVAYKKQMNDHIPAGAKEGWQEKK